MIKVKILNAQEGRNEPTFRPLLMVADMLREYSIDLTHSNSYDYLFIGMNDFIDKSQPLQKSIDFGLERLSKINGDYFFQKSIRKKDVKQVLFLRSTSLRVYCSRCLWNLGYLYNPRSHYQPDGLHLYPPDAR